MLLNAKKIGLLKWIIKDEFKHEFSPLMLEIKKKLNIKVNRVFLFLILLVYQYAFVFLLLLLLYNIKENTLFLVALLMVSLFNLLLPRTIACTSAQRIEENPVFECLLMSELTSNQSKQLMVLSELGSFWIHNFYLEIVSVGLFIIKYKLIGVLYSLMWVILVSLIFLRVMLKKITVQYILSATNSLRLYAFNLIVGVVIVSNIFYFFVGTLNKIPVEEIWATDGLKNYVEDYINNITYEFKDHISYLLVSVIILVLIYIFVRIWQNNVQFIKINKKKEALQYKYMLLICRLTKNFFVQRDVKIIFSILPKLNINVFNIIVPTGIFSLLTAFVFLINNDRSLYAVLISLDFIFWITIYQFAYFLVQKIPVFHISSELRNIELIIMSKSTMEQFIKSKNKLLALFCYPLLILIIIEKFILACLGCDILIVLFSLLIDVLIFEICILLSLKWTLILPKFDWTNIFMLKIDNFDSQILRQFLLIPSRIVTVFFSISFIFVVMADISYDFSTILLYYFLTLVGAMIMYCIFKRRSKDEMVV